MKYALFFSLLLFLATASGIVSCKKDAGSASELTGTWKLISREDCYCVPGVLDETVTFTATGFTFTRGGQVVRQGTYAQGKAAACGTTAVVPVLAFTDVTNQSSSKVPFTLDGQKLVLDYRNRCISDSPVDTYQRLP